jgi:hypothetical protein
MIRAAIILDLTIIVQYNGSFDAMSARKKTANHGNIQMRSRQERRRPTRASSTTASRNASSSTSSTAKETTART